MTTRRQFVELGAACAVSGLGPASHDLHTLAHPALLSLLGPQAVREIGVRYRELVDGDLPLGKHQSIPHLVRDDFAHGRTVVIEGWVLAVTEARQCALFSLHA
jgi:hypothetical protein